MKNKYKLHTGYNHSSDTLHYTYFTTLKAAQEFWDRYLKKHNILLCIEKVK